MKRKICCVLCVCVALLLLGSCGQKAESDGRLRVVASFYPIYDFAQKIGGDKIELTRMLPDGAEVHHWEPSSKDIAQLEQADVFLYNGLGMEHWVEDILSALQSDRLLVVETAKGAALLPADDAEHADNDEHDHGEYDPHTWLSPQNAKKQMESIKNAFIQADPANAETYQSNYEKYAAELDKLDGEFRAELESLYKRDVVVTHRAFAYLCNAYGLRQVGLEGVSHESEPSPDQLGEAIRFIRDNGISTVFYEQSGSDAVAKAIAAETGVKTAPLSTLETLTEKQQAAGDDYFSIMRQNLAAIKEALQ